MTTTGTQAAYYGLNIAGGVGLVVLLATTLLSRRVKKQPMLINMYITCIYEAFTAPILFYANQYTQRGDGLMVPRIKAGSPLCFAQAIIFTPTPPLIAAAAFALVLQIFLIVRSIKSSSSITSATPSIRLVAFPYIVYILVAIPLIVTAALKPVHTVPRQLYCTLDLGFVSWFVGIIGGVLVLAALLLQITIILMLRRDHAAILSRSAIDISLVLRGALFAIYLMITVGLSVRAVQDFTAVVPDLMVSTVPLAIMVIFGTQRDLLSSWRSLLTTNPATTVKQWMGSSHHASYHDDSLAMHSMHTSHRSQTSRRPRDSAVAVEVTRSHHIHTTSDDRTQKISFDPALRDKAWAHGKTDEYILPDDTPPTPKDEKRRSLELESVREEADLGTDVESEVMDLRNPANHATSRSSRHHSISFTLGDNR